jgi:hypothetical protein
VSAPGVIEAFDVVEDHEGGGGSCWRNRTAKAFGFQRSHEAFRPGIIIRITFAGPCWQLRPRPSDIAGRTRLHAVAIPGDPRGAVSLRFDSSNFRLPKASNGGNDYELVFATFFSAYSLAALPLVEKLPGGAS